VKFRSKQRSLVAVLAAALAILAGVSDRYGWTDSLSGRASAQQGLERLSSTKGYPEIIIFDDEEEFSALWSLIERNTSDSEVVAATQQGKIPTAIVRLGGTLTAPVGEMPPGGPEPRFVPDSSPILVFYNYERGRGPIRTVPESERVARPVGNIGDLQSWIHESKEAERFLITVILIGFISVILAFFEWRETEP
jgi:hypothetical protein